MANKIFHFKSETRNMILVIIRDLFFAGFAFLAIFSGLEIIKPRIVLNYINLDIFLIVLIVLGALTGILYQPEIEAKLKIKFWGNLAILLISIIIGLALIYLAKNIGYLSVLVGLSTAIICYYLIILCLEE